MAAGGTVAAGMAVAAGTAGVADTATAAVRGAAPAAKGDMGIDVAGGG
jgi:hypothetical protein